MKRRISKIILIVRPIGNNGKQIMNIYGVIMAGGSGTRFWPLSRKEKPKQLLNLSGKDVMLNEAIDRLSTITSNDNIFIVTNAKQVPPVKAVTKDKIKEENILSEPDARNTAACIGYAAVEILKKYGDGIMVITPADHYIKNVPELTRLFNLAVTTAESADKLITIGITPTYPSTGFGYIQSEINDSEVKPVLSFKEKPDTRTAEEYIASGDYTWNSGMFIWKASAIMEKFKEFVPDIYDDLIEIQAAIGTGKEQETINEIYPNIRKISIDYAVMEPASIKNEVMVIPGDIGWNDIGSWDMLDVLHSTDEKGNISIGDAIQIETSNTYIYSTSRTVTALVVEDLIVVETPDAVMVCRKDKAQDVKKIVDVIANKETLL